MPWCIRADAAFDIHAPDDIYRRRKENTAFDAWLSASKGIPFYTPKPVPDCPDNVVFPVEEITEKILSHFLRGDKPNAYFTSGPCYAIAMAIRLGYKRIELYGIEMENNTEYLYQRDGVGLWCGIAAGMGIDVVWSERSMMFYAPLYGYEMDATRIDREAFEARASELQILMEKTHSEYNKARGTLDATMQEFLDAQSKGATPEELQAVAQKVEDATNTYEQAIANHAFINGQYIDSRAWQARVERVLEYNGGALKLMAEKDEKWVRMADKLELVGREIQDE